MSSFLYTRDRPNPPNNPSSDVPDMKVNTNSIDDIISVDHVSFNESNGGFHNQTRLLSHAVIPAALIAGIGTLYTKQAASVTELFYTPDNSGDEYQITRTNTTNFSLFAQLVNDYNSVGTKYDGGWTFLPGGLLLQYGKVHPPTANGSVTFPIAFTSDVFSVQLTARNDNTSGNHSAFTYYINGALSLNSFTYAASTSGSQVLFWIAIGM